MSTRHPLPRFLAATIPVLVATAGSAAADSIPRARVTVDATDPGAVTLRTEITWTADEGKARSSVDLYLVRDVAVTAVTEDGSALRVRSEDVSGTRLKVWTVRLSGSLPAGESRSLTIRASLDPSGSPGIRVGPDGGFFLPGSGWFPQTSPEADEIPAHTTEFLLPEGMTGIAAGSPGTDGSWEASAPGRPYAVWGAFEMSSVEVEAEGVGARTLFQAYRRPGASGPVPRAETLAGLTGAIETGLGPPCGSEGWKLIDLGDGVPRGGRRTLFWDEGAAARTGEGPAGLLLDRDLAGALATGFWTECLRFRGDLGAFLSRGMPLYVGDIAHSALKAGDDRSRLESVTIRGRRSVFLQSLAGDRPLKGLLPASPGAETVLEGRGALAAHLLGETAHTRSWWISFLARFRKEHLGGTVDWAIFGESMGGRFGDQMSIVRPYLETTDLPDFHIVSHGIVEKSGRKRYRVEVENRGLVPALAEVAIYGSAGGRLRDYRVLLEPGGLKAILFGETDNVARIELDPRGLVLQADVSDEVVEVKPVAWQSLKGYVPSFEFSPLAPGPRPVEDLELKLDGVTIRGFQGLVIPYGTHHGPSGACLLGEGEVTIRPGPPFAEAWREAMGREALRFDPGSEMWIRFPLAAWEQIRPHLGEPVDASHRAKLLGRRRQVFEFSFPTYFFEEGRAQVPPPGSSLVIFQGPGGERRGFARVPLPDGNVKMRFWDHLSGQTLWEETR